jgi:hypothetical protein
MMNKNMPAFIDQGGRIEICINTRRNVHAAVALAHQYVRRYQGEVTVKGSKQFHNFAEHFMRERGIHPQIMNVATTDELLSRSPGWITGPFGGAKAAPILLNASTKVDPTTGFAIVNHATGKPELRMGTPYKNGVRPTRIFIAENSGDRVLYQSVNPASNQKSALPVFVDTGSVIALIHHESSPPDPSFTFQTISAMILLATMKRSWIHQIALPEEFGLTHPFTLCAMREAIRQNVVIINVSLQSEYLRLKHDFTTLQENKNAHSQSDAHTRAEVWARGQAITPAPSLLDQILGPRPNVSPNQPSTMPETIQNKNQPTPVALPHAVLTRFDTLPRSDRNLITSWYHDRLEQSNFIFAREDLSIIEDFLAFLPTNLTTIEPEPFRESFSRWSEAFLARSDIAHEASFRRFGIVQSFCQYAGTKGFLKSNIAVIPELEISALRALPPFLFGRNDFALLRIFYERNADNASFGAGLEYLLMFVPNDFQRATKESVHRAINKFIKNLVVDMTSGSLLFRTAIQRWDAVRRTIKYAREHSFPFPDVLQAAEASLSSGRTRLYSVQLPQFDRTRRVDSDLVGSWYDNHKKNTDARAALASFLKFAPPNLLNATAQDFRDAIDAWILTLFAEIDEERIRATTAFRYVSYMKSLISKAERSGISADISQTTITALTNGQIDLRRPNITKALPDFIEKRPDKDFISSFYRNSGGTHTVINALEGFLRTSADDLTQSTTDTISRSLQIWLSDLRATIDLTDPRKTTMFKITLAQRYIGVVTSFFEYGHDQGYFSREVMGNARTVLSAERTNFRKIPATLDLPQLVKKRPDSDLVESWLMKYARNYEYLVTICDFLKTCPSNLREATGTQLNDAIGTWTSRLITRIVSNDIKSLTGSYYVAALESFFKHNVQSIEPTLNHFHEALSTISAAKKQIRDLATHQRLPAYIAGRPDKEIIDKWFRDNYHLSGPKAALKDFLANAPTDLRKMDVDQFSERIHFWLTGLEKRIELGTIQVRTALFHVKDLRNFFHSCEQHLQPGIADATTRLLPPRKNPFVRAPYQEPAPLQADQMGTDRSSRAVRIK